MMKKQKNPLLLLFCGLFLFGSAPVFALPYIGYVYPSGARRGETVTMILGGQGFRERMSAYFSGAGVEVVSLTVVPGIPTVPWDQRKYLLDTLKALEDGTALPLPPDAAAEKSWHKCAWFSRLAELTPLERDLVARGLLVRRNALQDAPSLRQLVILKVKIAQDAPLGERELRLYTIQGASAPRPFFIDDVPHAGLPFYTPKHRKEPELPVIAPGSVIDGKIMPGKKDCLKVRLNGGKDFFFALKGRYLQPFIGDAVPGHFQAMLRLLDANGKELFFADDEGFDPDPILRGMVPESGEYTLEVRDFLWRGREDFVYRIEFGEGEKPFAFAPSPFGDADVVTGVLAPGECRKILFQGRKGETFSADVAARRCGSPLDGFLQLRDAAGTVVAENDDREAPFNVGRIVWEADPALLTTLPHDGEYSLELRDRAGKGGRNYRYYLRYGAPRPDFAVYMTRSALNIPFRGTAQVTLRIERRDGFSAPIHISAPDLKFEETIPGGVGEFVLKVPNPLRRSQRPRLLTFLARAEVGGKGIEHPVIPCDEYLQAFAYTHLLPARELCLSALPMRGGQPKQKSKKAAPAGAAKSPSARN